MPAFESLLYRYLNVRPESDVENALRLIVQTGVLVIDAEEGSLLAYDDEARNLCFTMNTGSEAAQRIIVGQRVPLNMGITGLAAATREVHIGSPTYKDVRQLERADSGSKDPEAVIAAPMVLHDNLIGVITAVSFKPGKRFTSRDARVYGSFAAIAALVIDQEQRLGRYERSAERPFAASAVADEAEAQIAASVGRIARERPYLLRHVAGLLERTEKIAFGEDLE
jgi:GAF domain-containing protein